MKELYKRIGLESLFDAKEALSELYLHDLQHANQHTRSSQYTVPGYKTDYYHYPTSAYVEFLCAYDVSDPNQKIRSIDLHFSSDSEITLFFDHAVDCTNYTHQYRVKISSNALSTLPLRVVCPDVLPDLEIGDSIYGQLVAFADFVISESSAKADPYFKTPSNSLFTKQDSPNTVYLIGEISEANLRTFDFRGYHSEFWELDVETELGMVTTLVLPNAIDCTPEVGTRIFANVLLSMDVAVPPKHLKALRNVRRTYSKKYEDFYLCQPNTEYFTGFLINEHAALRILKGCLINHNFNRFQRCCAPNIQITHANNSTVISRNLISEHLQSLLSFADETVSIRQITFSNNGEELGRSCIVLEESKFAICLYSNNIGYIEHLHLFSTDTYNFDSDPTLFLLHVLGQALCNHRIDALTPYIHENCVYHSDYSKKSLYGLKDIIERISNVDQANNDRTAPYHYKIVSSSDELYESDLPNIYRCDLCMRLYHGEKDNLVSIVFIDHNTEGLITNILLSNNKNYLSAFNSKNQKTTYTPLPARLDTLLQSIYGKENTIMAMRQKGIPENDLYELYAWEQSDQYIASWLQSKGYQVIEMQPQEDCIGYTCVRNGVEYVLYLFAFGETRRVYIDGDYCAKLRDLPMSKKRTILVMYVHVDRCTKDDGTISYTVGNCSESGDDPELWMLNQINGKNILQYYIRKEMIDLDERLIAAFNSQRKDILLTLFDEHIFVEDFRGGHTMNNAVYTTLSLLHNDYGCMKKAYIRNNDIVYSLVPYIENYCYINFTFNSENKIDSITLNPLHERYRELLITDEVFYSHPIDVVPSLTDVEFITPAKNARYSILMTFENGERRQYNLPGDFGEESVTEFRGRVITDKIFKNGRIGTQLPMKQIAFSCSVPPLCPQGIEFINGVVIPTTQLYHNSYPIEQFTYHEGANLHIHQQSYDESGFAVGSIYNLDPSNPMYLLDKNTMTAKTLPEIYQNTPILIYPFCGGCSEGLIMVSLMGDLDLQYHHNFNGCAGLWGWIDKDFNSVIEPQYVYATNFVNGRAVVCKGDWSVENKDDKQLYWCDNEQWGVIDHNEHEVVPCRFDELYCIDGTDRYYLVHEGGWDSGQYSVYDTKEQDIAFTLDFDFDLGYMFNECFVSEDNFLVFIDHLPGKGTDLVYAYNLNNHLWLVHGYPYTERTYNGENRVVVEKDGKEIIIF